MDMYVPVFFGCPGLLLSYVHVNEECVEPKVKHLLLNIRQRENMSEYSSTS